MTTLEMTPERSPLRTPDRTGTLPGLFRARVQASPDAVAYRQFDTLRDDWVRYTWAEIATEVDRWQAALHGEGLQPGDRVAMMLRNGREWIIFDQAALGLGLVTVPLYTDDRPDNIAYILEQTETRLLLVEGKLQWRRLLPVIAGLSTVRRVVALHDIAEPNASGDSGKPLNSDAPQDSDELRNSDRPRNPDRAAGRDRPTDPRLTAASEWLSGGTGHGITRSLEPEALATIVYPSGTTGRPKGVMLSHRNILSNARGAAQCGPLGAQDVFLSFLPLSHTLERTAGCYLPMLIGAEVAFARSIQQLGEDLVAVRPTVLISVPRIYEGVYAKIQAGLKQKSGLARALFAATVATGWARFERVQGRAGWSPRLLLWPLLNRLVARQVLARLGGRMAYAVCGGAPLPPPIARFFIGLGLPVYHGYGLTEASPVVTANRPHDNLPASIGTALPEAEIRIGAQQELLTRGPSVMLGYWENPEATAQAIDAEGWLHTGDKARIDAEGHVFITGRIKDIIVLGSGEKVPPADMEMAIQLDPLFDQVLVLGEGRAFLSALIVLNPEAWREAAAALDVDPEDAAARNGRFVERSLLTRVNRQLKDFPGYAQIRRLCTVCEPWSVETGLLTPTLKMKRERIVTQLQDRVEALYADY